MARPRCALAILPSDYVHSERLLDSLGAAIRVGLGDLREIVPLSRAGDSPRDALALAARAAHEHDFEWLLAVSAAETLAPDIFIKAAPALRIHDVVWGAAGLVRDGLATPIDRVTRLAAQDLATYFHAALRWWIGPAHFVRPAAALRALDNVASTAWYADYMVALWRDARALKTAQPLTLFHGELPPVPETDKRRLVDVLQREPVFMTVRHGNSALRLPYTGLNPVIEREQARGQFFEHEELEFLAGRLPPGLRIIDAGANTGNHTLFFASVMQARTVLPIEPEPRAAAAIRTVVAENGLENVDLSCLGKAVGAEAGRLKPVYSEGGGLGATRFVPDRDGEVILAPLDALMPGPVDFLKIDVEGMEMEVLAGANRLIARYRPAIVVEVLDAAIPVFLAWVDANSYRIEKLFPDKSHCNYFLVPAA